MIVRSMLTVAVILIGSVQTAAAEGKFSLQYRPRIENKGAGYGQPRISWNKGYLETSHRLRMGGRFSFVDVPGTLGVVEVQDVRLFGEESDTLADYSADGVDFHQGYVKISPESWKPGLVVGRQELAYDDHRLLGNVDWTQQGRSHDAVVIQMEPESFTAHLGAAKSLSQSRLETTYARVFKTYSSYQELAYLWIKAPIQPATPSVWAMVDTTTKISTRWTLGPRIEARTGGVQAKGEFYYQGVKEQGVKQTHGYLLGLSAGDSVSAGPINYSGTLYYDLVSPKFNSLYPTAHKFFGTMDLFLVFPRDTQSKGLHDPALKLAASAADWKAMLDVHYFMLLKTINHENRIGPEVDLTFPYKFNDVLTLTAGASAFFPGKGMDNLKGTTPPRGAFTPAKLKTSMWSFLMLDARF